MTVALADQRRMAELLLKAERGRLTPKQERDLRTLVVRHNPRAADLPHDWLVKAGLVVIGVELLRKALHSTR
ncbi:MAG: hypothetical protein QOD77_1510 [Thermoplasmata archaeon]|jgi:hypothetical protein|nr:hypothetical protein [Thermoplasmata archaeon]